MRGNEDTQMSVGKVFGAYAPPEVVGPDPLYKLQLLKDESKNNRIGRPEIMGIGRHKHPLLCGVNAIATMLILRFGRGGVIGVLPDVFNQYNDWPSENSLITGPDGRGMMEYLGNSFAIGHVGLFEQMKIAAGLEGVMADTLTKLRSFGAMHASDHQASHPEIERSGRCPTATPPPLPQHRYPTAATPPQGECEG